MMKISLNGYPIWIHNSGRVHDIYTIFEMSKIYYNNDTVSNLANKALGLTFFNRLNNTKSISDNKPIYMIGGNYE